MKNHLFNSFFLVFSLVASANCFGQNIAVNSHWDLTPGTAQTFLNQQGIHNLILSFLQNDVAQLDYDLSSGHETETSTWLQIDPTHFKMSFDPNGTVFGTYCPDDTMTVDYAIINDTLEMVSITSTCSLVSTFLSGSKWRNEVSTASLESIKSLTVSIYPNPVMDKLIIVSSVSLDKNSIAIYSSEGKKLDCPVQFSSSNEYSVNVEHLPHGTYILEVLDAQENSQKVSFIK